jgi:AAA domain-containing protein
VRAEQFTSAVEVELKKQHGMTDKAAPNGKDKAEPKKEPPPLIITMDQIKAEKVDWLWKNRIPIGRLTLLDGDPGSGKSSLSLAIASAVSKAEALPFGLKPAFEHSVLLMSCEDGYADTVRPLLDALGADVSSVVSHN